MYIPECMSYISTSCKGCTSRYVGCHAHCERYAAFRRERDAARKKALYDTLRPSLVRKGEHW
jgi:hypothetical protein